MFFEPPQTGQKPPQAERFRIPPWSGPAELEIGSVVPVERVVARSDNVVVMLSTIRSFRTGCALEIEIVARKGALSTDDWWDLRTSLYQAGRTETTAADRLPDKLLRLGVRYDGETKATTLDQRCQSAASSEDPPPGPILAWLPGGAGIRGGELAFNHINLWLWPLPPAHPFEFAVEWPFGGIDVTITELDGAAINAAAARSLDYWPADT
jgi:hypothetical protein